MAVADIFVGAINMSLSAIVDVLISGQVLSNHVCMLDLVNVYFMYTITTCSLYHLTVIAWERYVAIQKWIQYKVIVTRDRVKILAIVSWLAAVFTTLPGIVTAALNVDHKFLVTVILAGLVLILMAYFYIMVYLGVRKQNRSQVSRVSALVKWKMESCHDDRPANRCFDFVLRPNGSRRYLGRSFPSSSHKFGFPID